LDNNLLKPIGEAMNYATQLFVDAVKNYPAFKELFKQFCDEAAKRLNDNAQLPNVKFSPDADGASAKLQALDCTFGISLRFLIVETIPWGVLQVFLTSESKEPVRLFHLFFDNLGNVKAAPDASADLHSLSSTKFVETFINRVVQEYFSHQLGILK
jgi:hypothetical protein